MIWEEISNAIGVPPHWGLGGDGSNAIGVAPQGEFGAGSSASINKRPRGLGSTTRGHLDGIGMLGLGLLAPKRQQSEAEERKNSARGLRHRAGGE